MTTLTAEDIFPYTSLPKVAVDRCPVCETQPTRAPLTTHDRFGYAIQASRCPSCGLIYLREQLTRDGYDQLYAGAYRRLTWALSHEFDRLSAPTRVPICPFLPQYQRVMIQTFPQLSQQPVRAILDAGGSVGTGGKVVASLFRPAPHVTVLDPAAQELPDDVMTIQGYLEDPIPGRYDLAVCFETIDHLTDPIAALHNLRAAAHVLYVDFIDIQRLRGQGYAGLKIDHPLNWTPRAIAVALKRTGWTPLQDGYLLTDPNPSLQPYRVLVGAN